MSESDTSVQRIQVSGGIDWINLSQEKARVYASDLVNNPTRLKDSGYCNLLYGVFQGSEGDYAFHQKNAIEQLAMTTQIIVVDRARPATVDEHASWFLESILSGNSADVRSSVLSRKDFDYEHGDLYRAIQSAATNMGLGTASVRSICEVYGDLTQTVDYNLPYLPGGQRSNIDIVFTQVDKTISSATEKSGGVLRVGDQLPEHYQAPLEEIYRTAPDGFKEQATRLAYYFHALDNNLELVDTDGSSLQDEVSRLAQEVADLPSVSLVYAFASFGKNQPSSEPAKGNGPHVKNRRFIESIPPEKCLPDWVTSRVHLEDGGAKENGIPQASEFYGKYAPAHAERRDLQHGTYYFYDRDISPPRGESPADIFKCYIEHDAPQAQMAAAFNELAELKIHPHSSKLFEGDRIVLYWDTYLTQELSEKLEQTFKKHDIPYRGFGQDSLQVRIEEGGDWKFGIRSSNDQARGEAGGAVDFYHDNYNPQRFFELYIQQMLRHCRNPLDPYRMSFVPVTGESNSLKNQEQLKSELSEIEKRGLDVAWYKDGVPILFR